MPSAHLVFFMNELNLPNKPIKEVILLSHFIDQANEAQ